MAYQATTPPRGPIFDAVALAAQGDHLRQTVHVVRRKNDGAIGVSYDAAMPSDVEALASLPPTFPEWLGDRGFAEVHGVRFPYVAGEMANGIATVDMVAAMAQAEMLAFFGAGGLAYERVAHAVAQLKQRVGSLPWGVNLIHSPAEPELEQRVAALLLTEGVSHISVSAFMALTPAVVRCAATGLRVDANGHVQRRHHIFAKISRAEVAKHFMAPAPASMLQALVAAGQLTASEAALARTVPVAEDITVEADSGGHTDNQSLVALFPTIMELRDHAMTQYGYRRPIRVGAAGGLGSPAALAAAFSMGAAYVVTGSVNQTAVEAGIAPDAKALLAQAEVADVIMAPAADMFELGVKVQVLRRGTMFGVRASKLYELYRDYASLEALPTDARTRLERDYFRASLDDIWRETLAYWQRRDAALADRGLRDPKFRMALVFRWYLGKASRWAIDGEPSRAADYQIWCGPAMGSFNQWAAGSFLEAPAARGVVQIAYNLLEGAAVIQRASQLRALGVAMPSAAFQFRPRLMA